MQHRAIDNNPYSLAIKQGNLRLARVLVNLAGITKHPELLEYVLNKATYSDAIKKEIVLFICQIDPASILNFVGTLDFPQFKKFVELGVDVNVHQSGISMLHMIGGMDQYSERAELLISKGAPLHHLEQTKKFGTFMHVSLANENFAEFAKVLDHVKAYHRKIDFHLRDGEGKTVLLLATKVMAYTPIKRILEEDPSCLEIPDNEGRTPLHIACALGNCAIVELLIRAGANLNARDKLGNTPAYYAATSIETVKTILSSISIDPERDMFAEFNALRYAPDTPLVYSEKEAQSLHLRVTSAPASYCEGTDRINVLSCIENKRVLENMQYLGMQVGKMEYLQKFMRSFCGKTIAEDCVSGHLAVMKMLIRYQADISLQNDAGVTPRQSATDTDIVACLKKAESAATIHRSQTWCLSFAMTRSVVPPISPMKDGEPTDSWHFYQDAPGLRL